MPRKRSGLGHRHPPIFLAAHKALVPPPEPSTIRAWREWLVHQYEPGYWVGRQIPPFLAASPTRQAGARGRVRWLLALPLLAIISLSWLGLVAALVASPDERQPVPSQTATGGLIDFHVIFPCWVPEAVKPVPGVGVSQSDRGTALISYEPRRPSHVLGGLVPSRVGLYLRERRDQFGLGRLSLPGQKQRVGDIDVAVASDADEPSINHAMWVKDGIVFEMAGAGVTTDELLAVAESTFEPCTRANQYLPPTTA